MRFIGLRSGAFTGMSAAFVVAAAMSSPADAQSTSNAPKFVTFSSFKSSIGSSKAEDYVGQPSRNVLNAGEFALMRQYLQQLYDGVSVTHSFLQYGQTFGQNGIWT